MKADSTNPSDSAPTAPDGPDDKNAPISAQLRGETMAYAVQSAFYNLGANIFEPYVNYRIQKYYAGRDPSNAGNYGNYTQNLAGELAGDLAGAGALMFAESFFPEQLHTVTRRLRSWVDPLYTSVAHKVLAKEAARPDYDQVVEKWKTYQERNLVRSAIIATAGIAGNLLTQKAIVGNPAPTKLIFAGKLVSTLLTTTLGLSVRMGFPEQTKAMDKWIGQRVFAPMLKDKGTLQEPVQPSTHVDKLENGSVSDSPAQPSV